MIASTDLSHFYDQKKANKLDSAVRTAIEMFDAKQLVRVIQSGQGEACGAGPVASVMQAAKRLGSKEVRFLEYTTSGETTGDFSEVVGYLSAAIVASKDTSVKPKPDKSLLGAKPAAPNALVTISEEDKDLLKRIAHDAIGARLKLKSYEPPTTESLDIKRGLFVTIKLDGELRGCIGQLKSRQPLCDAVADMALAAAFEDPRFPELTAAEYERLEYEISVLSALERVKDFRDIKVGRDGLMIKLDMHSGLLLPQVATEYGWDRTQFLEQTCLKAGLPKESYKDKFAEIYRFAAVVF
jgi:AmmeMemoRadiSam system protein A